jgi:dienelactone hydrolase
MNDTQTEEIKVIKGIHFGTALVGYNEGKGPMKERSLLMDVYYPAGHTSSLRPALILAFGGAFHRGTREDDTVHEDGHTNTPIAEYCRRFAGRGYVCASIDYRLTQEDPHPGDTLVFGNEDVPRSRIDHVRGILGLPPSTAEMIRNVQEAGVDDMAAAFRFMRVHADEYGVDRDRIVVGGFSAGGRIALNAALADDIEPAAAIGLSAYVPDVVLNDFAGAARARFPIFLCRGENDLEYVCARTPEMCEHFERLGIPFRAFIVPGGTHFYSAEATVHGREGLAETLEHQLAAFLSSTLEHDHPQRRES